MYKMATDIDVILSCKHKISISRGYVTNYHFKNKYNYHFHKFYHETDMLFYFFLNLIFAFIGLDEFKQ